MSSVTDPLRPVADGLFSVDPPALIGGQCASCGALSFPRRAWCPECQGSTIEEVALARTGVVYTFTIVHMVPPGYLGEAPYAYGVVELPEGLRVTTTLLADDLDAIEVGDPCSFELLELGAAAERVLSFAYRASGGVA
jgi:uncharacterized OB-fold protein